MSKHTYYFLMGEADNHPPLIEVTCHVIDEPGVGREVEYVCSDWLTDANATLTLSGDAYRPTLDITYRCPTGRVSASLRPRYQISGSTRLVFQSNGSMLFRKSEEGVYIEQSNIQSDVWDECEYYWSAHRVKYTSWVKERSHYMEPNEYLVSDFPYKESKYKDLYYLDMRELKMIEVSTLTPDNLGPIQPPPPDPMDS